MAKIPLNSSGFGFMIGDCFGEVREALLERILSDILLN
jgi:hypothetical protein